MLLRLDHPCYGEGLQGFGRIVHRLDLKADKRQLLGYFLKACVGFQMILEPGQGEFHRRGLFVSCFSWGFSTALANGLSSGRNRRGQRFGLKRPKSGSVDASL